MFVTGGNGFLGSVVVRQLCEAGWTVRCLLRPSADTRRIDHLPIERVVGDLSSPESLSAAMAGCDGVLHLASIASWSAIDSSEMEAVVVGGTANVLTAARRAGNLRMVYVSSAAAINGTPAPCVQDESASFNLDPRQFAYAAAKRRAEDLVGAAAADGLSATIVNPVEIYGPEDTFLVTAGNVLEWLKSRLVLVCNGGTAIVHVDDAAAGVIAAWHHGRCGERYILGGENLTLVELARLSLDCAGFTMRPVSTLPTGPVRAAARLSRWLRLPFPVPPALIPYATRYWYFSSAKAERELGLHFRPAKAVIESTVDWLVKAGHLDCQD